MMKRRLKQLFLLLVMISSLHSCSQEEEQQLRASIGEYLESIVKEQKIIKVLACCISCECSAPVDYRGTDHEFLANDMLRIGNNIRDLRTLIIYRIDEVIGQGGVAEKRMILLFPNT
jgi:hypothetical protein